MARPERSNSAKNSASAPGLASDHLGGGASAGSDPRMKPAYFNTTLLFYPNKNPKLRLFALWYFTTLMIVWNTVGHIVLGFEQSWATPLTAITTAVLVSMLLDWVDARTRNRELRFTGSLGNFLN